MQQIYGNSANAVSTQPEVRQPEVQQEFVRVEEAASYIDKITEELEAKLSGSILAQRAETGSASSSTPEPVRVPVAQRLYDLGTRLERVRQHLSSILDRIEA